MDAITIQDSKILIPNTEHKNFVETNSIIPKGTEISGDVKVIDGLRRGAPFTYRLFETNNKELLFLKNIEPMNTREITLGADGQTTPTVVDLLPAESFNRTKKMGLVIGAIAGFGYAKYKKHDMKKVAMYIGVGAVAGYLGAYIFDWSKKVVVTPSK
jgi:hypothetical protein